MAQHTTQYELIDRGSRLNLETRNGLVLLAIFTIAVALRFYNLSTYPAGISGHVLAQFAIRKKFLEDFLLPLYSFDWQSINVYTFRDLFLGEETAPVGLLEAIGFSIWGVSLSTLRMLPALIGASSVVLIFVLVKKLIGYNSAIIASIILAAAPWHLAISRYDNLEHVFAPFHMLLTLNLFVWALASKRLMAYVILGASLGSSFFVYATNQIVPIMVISAWIVYYFFGHNRYKCNPWKFFVSICCTLALAWPHISFRFSTFGISLLLALRKSPEYRITSFSEIPSRLSAAFQQLFVSANDPWFSCSYFGMGYLEAFFLLPGILLSLRLLLLKHKIQHAWLLTWLFLSLLPGILGPDVPFRRLILFSTFAIVFTSIALNVLLQVAFRKSKTLAVALMLIFATYVGFNSFAFFNYVYISETMSGSHRYRLALSVLKDIGMKRQLILTESRLDALQIKETIDLLGYDVIKKCRRIKNTSCESVSVFSDEECSSSSADCCLKNLPLGTKFLSTNTKSSLDQLIKVCNLRAEDFEIEYIIE